MKLTRTSFTTASRTFSKRALSAEQKADMLSRIYSGENPSLSFGSPVRSPYQRFIRNPSFVMFVALLVLTSGTVYASSQSLPGDALYGIKVHVVEPISLALRVSEKDKDAYRATLIEMRAHELVLLRQKTGLGAATQSDATTTEMRSPTSHTASPKPTSTTHVPAAHIRGVSVTNEASSTGTESINGTLQTDILEVHATTSLVTEVSTTTKTEDTTEEHSPSLHDTLHMDTTVSVPPSVHVESVVSTPSSVIPPVSGSVLGL